MFVSRECITAQAHQPLQINKTNLRLSRANLPPVRQTYESELGCQLSRADHHNEAHGNCCFHQSKSGKSFRVNLESGLWFCHGCQTGGDMVSFIQRRHSFSFLEAARYLGALEETGRPSPPPVMASAKYLTLDFKIGGHRYSASVKDEPRNYASVVRRFYREASEQLTAQGLEQSESADGETYWTRMGLGLDELREIGLLRMGMESR